MFGRNSGHQLKQEIKQLNREPGNKRCADCNSLGANNIVVDFGIFVCPSCAGMHRDMNFGVKSLSAAVFTRDDVKKVKQCGNEMSNSKFLADISESIPDKKNTSAFRNFLREKYVNKKFLFDNHGVFGNQKEEAAVSATAAVESSKTETTEAFSWGNAETQPQNNMFLFEEHKKKEEFLPEVQQHTNETENFFFDAEEPVSKPTVAQQPFFEEKKPASSNDDMFSFFSNTPTTVIKEPTPNNEPQPTSITKTDVSFFEIGPKKVDSQPTKAETNSNSKDLFSLLNFEEQPKVTEKKPAAAMLDFSSIQDKPKGTSFSDLIGNIHESTTKRSKPVFGTAVSGTKQSSNPFMDNTSEPAQQQNATRKKNASFAHLFEF
ncbi:hypothetical protein PCE1_003216 [Barthelona sp. PCE]